MHICEFQTGIGKDPVKIHSETAFFLLKFLQDARGFSASVSQDALRVSPNPKYFQTGTLYRESSELLVIHLIRRFHASTATDPEITRNYTQQNSPHYIVKGLNM